ncbi:CoA transferase [Solirubrobacter ginsenosidimutans]|uniref:CoA transferase n=1 Tax=Solirubrobacter ginsenosidimutans TaxID=490573 RepID=A0A9X3MMT3_9ACTN|nr:CoA transferase [Solirubrobacter ginsenosidimutans]MDA0158995.1 CoA transferase [Solirubrobacter ginsenosidimutans]
MKREQPLVDLRVIAVEQFGAGPWATMQLADLGADVIKVEDPGSGGDVGRYVPPFQDGEDSLYFEAFNRNKRSISLDLRTPEGRATFEDLAATADAVMSNLRGGQAQKLGLTYDQLKHRNPRIVCTTLTGFGSTGPRGNEGGYDHVVQAMAGWMHITGDPDGPPTRSGLSLVDFSGGYVAALATLAAVHRARRDGVGGDCDLSLFETALAELNYLGTWAATAGYRPRRMKDSAHPTIVPFQAFQTRTGWITVACGKEHFWRRLCDAAERPELAERYPTFADRDRDRDELLPILHELFLQRTSDEWLALLNACGVPAGAVNTVAEAFEDPQAVARDVLVDVEHPRLGTVRHIASPLRVDPQAPPIRRAPGRGEHTAEVLRDTLGYSADQIAALESAE